MSESARRLEEIEVDEICILTKYASANPVQDLESYQLDMLSTPISYGGGVDTAKKALTLVRAGVERVVISPKTLNGPELSKLKSLMGEQALVLHLPLQFDIAGDGITEQSKTLFEATMRELRSSDFLGEVIVTSKGSEGTGQFIASHAAWVRDSFPDSVNLLFSGSLRNHQDVEKLNEMGYNGVVLGNVLHCRELFVPELKTNLAGLTRQLESFG